jgi:hypothetical protein
MLWRLLVVVEKVDKGRGRGPEGFIARLEDGLRDLEVENWVGGVAAPEDRAESSLDEGSDEDDPLGGVREEKNCGEGG